MADATCSINGCDNPVLARGWCSKHYDRWRKHGDPLIVRGRTSGPLSEETRQKISQALTGRTLPPERVEKARATQLANRDKIAETSRIQWEKVRAEQGLTAPGYFGLHRRVRKQRGSAKNYMCVDCGSQARDWAQVHGTDGTDVDAHYQAMCKKCHFAYDRVNKDYALVTTPEERSARAQLAWSRRTPEQRQEIGRKIWATRRANQEASRAASDPPLLWP